MSSFKNVDTVTTETSPLSSQDSRPLRSRLSLRAPGHQVWSEALLTPGPDLDQILQDLETNQNYHGYIFLFEDRVYLELLHDARLVVRPNGDLRLREQVGECEHAPHRGFLSAFLVVRFCLTSRIVTAPRVVLAVLLVFFVVRRFSPAPGLGN